MTQQTTEQQQPVWRKRLHTLRERVHHRRERIRHRPALNTVYRIVLGTIGTVVLLAGLVMVPYPGPGWLVVFAGLGILATEFAWAHHLNSHLKHYYHRWTHWLGRQSVAVKALVMGGTGLIVVITLWLLGLYATIGEWFGLHWSWLASPLFGP